MSIYDPIQNKYYLWYLSICNRCLLREKNLGLIKHHIDPKSFYTKYAKDGWKTTDPDIHVNLVYVTEREHFILHWLLTKCYEHLPKAKMVNAFIRMANGNKSSKYYEIARKLHIQTIKGVPRPYMVPLQKGDNNIAKRPDVRKKLQESITKLWTNDAHRKKLSGSNHWTFGKKRPDSSEWNRKNKPKTYLVTNPEGISWIITHRNNFCKEYGLNQGSVSLVVSGKKDNIKGWKISLFIPSQTG